MIASSTLSPLAPFRHKFAEIEPLESRIAPAVFIVTSTADSGPGTLRQALINADAAAGFDSIIFHLPAPPTHSENIITLASQLTTHGDVSIIGPGAGKLIINGNDAARVLLIDDGSATTSSPVSISGLSIVNGNAGTGVGGGILSHESLALKNVVITDCKAGSGGGVSLGNTGTALLKANISNSVISGNVVSTVGAGMSLYDLASLNLTKTLVTGNIDTSSTNSAGGAYIELAPAGTGVTIAGGSFTNNTALQGGGLFLNSYATSPKAKITITGTLISGNTATGTSGEFGGGGLYIQQAGVVDIVGSTISGNTSKNNGGGLQAKLVQSLNIGTTLISGNTAASVGGGFSIFANKLVNITGSVVSGNADSSTSKGAGGGYAEMNSGDTGINIVGSVISGNNANHGGGLFLNSYATSLTNKITLSATKITGNVSNGTSLAGGGGLYLGKGNFAINGCQISNNTANGDDGGGIEAKAFYSLSISKSVISGNQTLSASGGKSDGGGGIYAVGTGITMKPVLITGSLIGANTSHTYGGGIAATDGVSVTVLKSVFSTNRAVTDSGGAISTYGSNADIVKLTITSTTLKGNVAGGAGGGVNTDGTGTFGISSSIVTGNIAANQGGGLNLVGSAIASVTNIIASHNSSAYYGGAIEFENVPNFVVSGGSITANFASSVGGGIQVFDSTGSITGVLISGNTADVSGGGVSHAGTGTVTLQVATVIANSAAFNPDVAGTFTFI